MSTHGSAPLPTPMNLFWPYCKCGHTSRSQDYILSISAAPNSAHRAWNLVRSIRAFTDLAALRSEFSPDEWRPERTALLPISPNVSVPNESMNESSQRRRPPELSEFRYKRVTGTSDYRYYYYAA